MRLINADTFKESIIRGYEEYKGEFKTEKYLNVAKEVTKGFLMDIDEQPTIDIFAELEKELKDLKIKQNSENTDYYTGYISAVSTMEGIIAELKEKYEKGE